MPSKTLLLELNEVNFDAVRAYCERGEFPNLKWLLDHGAVETSSEARYELLEPWIQWVTAHTGLTYEQHKVYRLGDIVDTELPQIWEELEDHGAIVGAVSPMNAKNRTRNAAFFIPDPWPDTPVTGSFLAKRLYDAISQAVNDNANSRIAPQSLVWLLFGALRFARPVNYSSYARLALGARNRSWNKALFLDLLLSDVMIGLCRKSQPDFCSLFLNAAAHIQHHYMFSSKVYAGKQRNPDWYVSEGDDPVRDVYALYDRVLGQVRREFPRNRIMVATGLHQDPHPQTTYYWRLSDHAAFLNKHAIPFEDVEPRMSRDFLVRCRDTESARRAVKILESMSDENGVPLFSVDNRGEDPFVMLTYPFDIPDGFSYTANGRECTDLRRDVAFVAIKNGQHNGIGYFVDCGTEHIAAVSPIPLGDLPDRIRAAVLGEHTTTAAASRLD